jgi:hypothetical protein
MSPAQRIGKNLDIFNHKAADRSKENARAYCQKPHLAELGGGRAATPEEISASNGQEPSPLLERASTWNDNAEFIWSLKGGDSSGKAKAFSGTVDTGVGYYGGCGIWNVAGMTFRRPQPPRPGSPPAERHIRLLAPLAFLSPRIIAAIGDGTTPADLRSPALPRPCPIRGPSRSRAAYPLHAGQRVCRGSGLRAGVRLVPERCPANRSLSAIERLSHG